MHHHYTPPTCSAASRWTRGLTSIRIEYADGSGMTLGPSDGDLKISAKTAANKVKTPVYNRDSHDGFVLGQDMIQTLSITIQAKNESLTSAVAARLQDFFRRTGLFASSTSYDTTITDCFRLITTYNDGTTVAGEIYPKCEGSISGPNDGVPSTWSVEINNHTAPTVWTSTYT